MIGRTSCVLFVFICTFPSFSQQCYCFSWIAAIKHACLCTMTAPGMSDMINNSERRWSIRNLSSVSPPVWRCVPHWGKKKSLCQPWIWQHWFPADLDEINSSAKTQHFLCAAHRKPLWFVYPTYISIFLVCKTSHLKLQKYLFLKMIERMNLKLDQKCYVVSVSMVSKTNSGSIAGCGWNSAAACHCRGWCYGDIQRKHRMCCFLRGQHY